MMLFRAAAGPGGVCDGGREGGLMPHSCAKKTCYVPVPAPFACMPDLCRRDGGPHCPQADCHISQHYKLLLQLFLECLKAPGIMFLEEDLEIAPDFFSYFEATAPLMARDSSIYCVSAWNDHGQRGRAKDNRALYRTDVMPGLGWYVNSAIGLELAPKWPLTNWDDWMRLPGVKNGRSCIFPEVRVLLHAAKRFACVILHVFTSYARDSVHVSLLLVSSSLKSVEQLAQGHLPSMPMSFAGAITTALADMGTNVVAIVVSLWPMHHCFPAVRICKLQSVCQMCCR